MSPPSLLFSLRALHALARVVGVARVVRYTSRSVSNIGEAVRLQVQIEYLLQVFSTLYDTAASFTVF
jgi:hypothetical protein